MTTEPRTSVLTAQYHVEGYVTAAWDTSPSVALTAFAVTITYTREGNLGLTKWGVEDGMARSVGLPYRFEPGVQYALIVTPFDGEDLLSPSPPFPLVNPFNPIVNPPNIAADDDGTAKAAVDGTLAGGSSNLHRLEFVERLPYTPLFIDAGWNVVKVRLVGHDGEPLDKQSIHWRVPPDYKGVRLEKTKPTITDHDGIAVNRIRIDRGAQIPAFLTVSAWYEPLVPALHHPAHHVATLFESVEVRVFCSFARDSAHLWTIGGTPEPDELVTATATVLDDRSRPVRGLRMAWRMHPNAASAAYQPTAHGRLHRLTWTDTPSYERGYAAHTNELGRTTIKFANYAPQIMGVAPAVNAEEYPNHAIFSAVDLGTGNGPPVGLPLVGGVLDLDKYPDTVPVTVWPDVGVVYDAAIWLNDRFVVSVYIGALPQPGIVSIPSEYFVPGEQNAIGYTKCDAYGNGTDSILSKFRVRGKAHIPQPTHGGTLAPPRFGAQDVHIVNDSVIAGGLALWIPADAAIVAGDEIRLHLYLQGYYQNTDFKRYGFYEMTHGVQARDVAGGFLLVVDEAELRGFAASLNGEPGRFVAQYVCVPSAGTKKHYSKLLARDMATTVLDQAPEWVAFGREP